MGSISDIGNGYGLLYQVEKDTLKILTVSKNDKDGERSMKNIAVIDAPLSANRAATGLIEVVAVNSTGTIDTIEVNGIDILGTPYSVTTNDPETEAIGIAAAINAYTPISGYKYTASNVGGIVYLQSPLDVGAVANGFEIDVTVSDVSIETETTDFSGGATTTTVYDSLIGRRYYLNADYNASGVTNTLAAPVNALTNAIEITKYIVTRGTQVGIPSSEETLVSDGLTVSRIANRQRVVLIGEGAAVDKLSYIGTEGFVEGDILLLMAAEDNITVESKPVTTSPNPYKNIYLSNDYPCILVGSSNTIALMYLFSEAYGGGYFAEISRPMPTKIPTASWHDVLVAGQISGGTDAMMSIADKLWFLNANGATVYLATGAFDSGLGVFKGDGTPMMQFSVTPNIVLTFTQAATFSSAVEMAGLLTASYGIDLGYNTTGFIRFKNATNAFYVLFKAGVTANNMEFIWPTTTPAVGAELSVDSIDTTDPTKPVITLKWVTLAQYANNAAAITAGLAVGEKYYTNSGGDGIVKVVI